jgi:hypothetical protein
MSVRPLTLKLMSCVISVIAGVTLFSATVSAKELTNRLGVGVKQNSAINNLPELATVYYPTPDIGITGAIGIDTAKDASRFSFNGGIRRIIFKENQMNFYMGGRLGLVNIETAGDKKSGFELSGLFGGEFFFTGLDSLGFTFEGGVGVVSTGTVRFRTLGESPVSAGIIFYF